MVSLGEVIDDVAGLIHCLAVNEQTWDLTLTANLNEALTSCVISNDIMHRKLDVILLHKGHYLVAVWAGWLIEKLKILSSHKNSFVSNYYYFVYTHRSEVVSRGFGYGDLVRENSRKINI